MGRPKENRTYLHARVDPATPGTAKGIAKALGLTYARKGSIGKLLDAIACGEVILIKTSPKG